MSDEHFERAVTQKAVLFRPDGDVLLVAPAGDGEATGWSIPGGRLEVGETTAEGLRRELREETGLDALVRQPVLTTTRAWRDSEGALFAVVYACETDGGTVSLNHELDDYAWLSVSETREAVDHEFLAAAIERAAEVVA
jgi:8-oxo-dGTP diphosphatase